MPIQLSSADHRKLDALLNAVLEAHAGGEITVDQARSALAHVFTAAATGNEGEVRTWLKPETREEWRRLILAQGS
jgi:cell division inhibitor SulA